MKSFRLSMWRGWLVLLLPAAATSFGSSSVVGQPAVGGTVVDRTGRPLPFVVVTSRTRNGYLAVYTDVDGRFAFPGRPHPSGSIIEFHSVGYAAHTARPGDATELIVTLDSVGVTMPAEWSIGLARGLQLRLLSTDDSVIDPHGLRVGELYRLRILSRGQAGCSRRGPHNVRIVHADITVTLADFSRNRDCTNEVVQHERVVDVQLQQHGPGSIRVVGRYHDVELPITIVAGPPRGK